MRTWSTCGAFGDSIYELTWWEVAKFIWTRELDLGSSSVVVSIGKSRRVAHPRAAHGSREEQLAAKGP